ncbi:Wound-responsive family protein [Striga hermonthica]|uniref:Wound-responsive family protein n=1 Tax=Striga hermonthica TaxID=68872 RepID=A0A9N7MR21_STRHE|nr:Wound-responsive family protein [Striga hermonthica]
MSSRSKAWLVAASIGAVEAMKDQLGVCRWNYSLRLLQQHAKNNVRTFSQTTKISGQTSGVVSNKMKSEQSEESLRKVMYLSCWGPN